MVIMKLSQKSRFFIVPIFLGLCICFTSFHSPSANSNLKGCTCLSIDKLDFHRWIIGSEPMMSFFLFNHNGKLLSSMIPSADWIKIAEVSYENNLKEVIVKLDVSNLSPGLYQERLEFVSDDCPFVLPIRLDLVKQKTIVQMGYDIPTVLVNGKPFEQPAATFVRNGLSFIPIRITCEAFGARVEYKKEDDTRVILIKHQDQMVEIPFNNNNMMINGQKVYMGEEIQVRSGIAFLPILVLQKVFYFSTQYYDKCRFITIVN